MTKFLLYMKLGDTEIDEKKHIVIGLQSIYGIGPTIAKNILNKLNIPLPKKGKDLSSEEILKISKELDNYILGNDLKKLVAGNINDKIRCRSYEGIRHELRLPVRGQRTKTNSRTARKGQFSIGKSKASETASKKNNVATSAAGRKER